MKFTQVIATFAFAIFVVVAEPPAPRNSYSAPSSNYLPPQQNGYPQQQQQQQQPSQQYGAPSNNYQQQQQPSQQYGAPSSPSAPSGSGYAGNSYASAPSNSYGAPSGQGGQNGGYDYQASEPAKYEFEYKVEDFQSGNDFGHMESRDGDRTVGRYYVLLPDGRKQIVNYEADQNGYRPTITYEDTNAGGGYPNSQQGGNNNNNQFQGY